MPSLGVLYQIAVVVIDITLTGRESIVCLIDRRMGKIIYRKLNAVDRLRKRRPVAEYVIPERLLPVRLSARLLLRLFKMVDRIILERLRKTRLRYSRSSPRDLRHSKSG